MKDSEIDFEVKSNVLRLDLELYFGYEPDFSIHHK